MASDAYPYSEALYMELFWRMMIAFVLIMVLITVVMYVLQAIGLQKIARRRGIKRPWLAWIPLGEYWILGSISDRYHHVCRGGDRGRRKLLLGLMAVTLLVSCVRTFITWKEVWQLYQDPFALLNMDTWEIEEWALAVETKTSLGPLMDLAVSVAEIAGLVFYYICLYDLYTSCRPDLRVVFLVLSIIFSVTVPFFVFACRNAEMGMPPKRPQLPYMGCDRTWDRETPPDDRDVTGF